MISAASRCLDRAGPNRCAPSECAHRMLAMPSRRRAQLVEDPPLLRPFGRPVTLRHRRQHLAPRAHADLSRHRGHRSNLVAPLQSSGEKLSSNILDEAMRGQSSALIYLHQAQCVASENSNSPKTPALEGPNWTRATSGALPGAASAVFWGGLTMELVRARREPNQSLHECVRTRTAYASPRHRISSQHRRSRPAMPAVRGCHAGNRA
ncbi:hypothetical protein ACVWWG_006238 [Bradyrhizobium sp. LB7.2]